MTVIRQATLLLRCWSVLFYVEVKFKIVVWCLRHMFVAITACCSSDGHVIVMRPGPLLSGPWLVV